MISYFFSIVYQKTTQCTHVVSLPSKRTKVFNSIWSAQKHGIIQCKFYIIYNASFIIKLQFQLALLACLLVTNSAFFISLILEFKFDSSAVTSVHLHDKHAWCNVRRMQTHFDWIENRPCGPFMNIPMNNHCAWTHNNNNIWRSPNLKI